MFIEAHSSLIILGLSCLIQLSSARVVWIREDFNPYADNDNVVRRDSSVPCGGVQDLEQCGLGLPSDFCCASGTRCLQLNNTAATAVICCPVGNDCGIIEPVVCNTRYQNATLAPQSDLHSNPTQELEKCRDRCCPMGYSCKRGRCWAQSHLTVPKSTTTTSTGTTATQSTTKTTTDNGHASATPTTVSSGPKFNGKSFAAGFVPGIAIGALITTILLLFLYRKKFKLDDGSYIDEKRKYRDTLTDLGTIDEPERPSTHGRSISGPTIVPSSGYRTDFLRSSPPRANEGATIPPNGYSVNVIGPSPDATTPPSRIRGPFGHSPFKTPVPSPPEPSRVPGHLKQDTPSFKLSPVRALRKQRSAHSLRRQMADTSNTAIADISYNNSHQARHSRSRSHSRETIQVLMPSAESHAADRSFQRPVRTPEPDEPSYDLPDSATSWETDHDAPTPDIRVKPQNVKMAPRVNVPQQTPTRAPPIRTTSRDQLGSPYIPSNGKSKAPSSSTNMMPLPPVPVEGRPSPSLMIPTSSSRRDTTFSALMERAGLRKEDFLVGSGSGTEKARPTR